jgi:hypothetical protein
MYSYKLDCCIFVAPRITRQTLHTTKLQGRMKHQLSITITKNACQDIIN